MAVLGGTAGADASVGGRFPALILALRWATVTTGAVLSLVDLRHSAAAMAATSLLCLYAGFRILRPLPGPEGREAPAPAIAVELAVALAAVAISGGFGSPYVFALLVPVLLAGFTQGYAAGFLAAGAASLPLLVGGATVASARVPTETASQVALVYAATGALAGYARRLFVDAAAEQASFEDPVSSLTEANALLSQLTQVARTLPSSLDLGETVNAAMGHLGQLFDFTGATVLVLDAATGTWRAEGVTGLPEPLALAIDNGLWFDRLRRLGAEGERDRLARDLHDRFAQGLAYVNLELDRLSRHPAPGPQLVELRQQVGGLLGEVRETLRQLRSRVSPTAGLADLLAAELPRFADRTGITARFPAEPAPARLPVAVAQVPWRITQEALDNVERHAKASALEVTWTCDGRH